MDKRNTSSIMFRFFEFLSNCGMTLAILQLLLALFFILSSQSPSLDGVFPTLLFHNLGLSAVLSSGLFLLFLLIYGLCKLLYVLYRRDHVLPLLIVLTLAVPLCIYLPYISEFPFLDVFSGAWMNFPVSIVCSLLAVANIVFPIALSLHFDQPNRKSHRQNKPKSPEECAELARRKALKRAIQGNAVKVRFPAPQWSFSSRMHVLFGYDEENHQFVLVNDHSSHVIPLSSAIFLGWEKASLSSSKQLSSSKTSHAIIKLYYFDDDMTERILTFAALDTVFTSKLTFLSSLLDHIAEPAVSDELIFRNTIRSIGATLDPKKHPNRPFANDLWFSSLQACMQSHKNDRTDGYTLFRNQILLHNTYRHDDIVLSIVSDLSRDQPLTKSAEKEARKLCLYDTGAAIKHNLQGAIEHQHIF